jgi:hypothetical protein
MRNLTFLVAFVCAAALPVASLATMVDASLLPDGTYGVTVEKVVDSSHVTVAMVGGLEATLSAASASVHFDGVKANDKIRVSVLKGKVLSFTK